MNIRNSYEVLCGAHQMSLYRRFRMGLFAVRYRNAIISMQRDVAPWAVHASDMQSIIDYWTQLMFLMEDLGR